MTGWVYSTVCSIPFSLGDILRLGFEINLDDVELPPHLQQNSEFHFLLQRHSKDWGANKGWKQCFWCLRKHSLFIVYFIIGNHTSQGVWGILEQIIMYKYREVYDDRLWNKFYDNGGIWLCNHGFRWIWISEFIQSNLSFRVGAIFKFLFILLENYWNNFTEEPRWTSKVIRIKSNINLYITYSGKKWSL